MELRKTDWAAFLNDEKQGGWLVPIFSLAHEHNADPEMRNSNSAAEELHSIKLLQSHRDSNGGSGQYFKRAF
jgi:hypothetical protein